MNDLNSVVISQKADGSWQALHVPSGKTTHGLTKDEAEEAMRASIGINNDGQFEEPLTSSQYEGLAQEIAEYLEGPVSDMLNFTVVMLDSKHMRRASLTLDLVVAARDALHHHSLYSMESSRCSGKNSAKRPSSM